MANDFRGYVQSHDPYFLQFVGNDVTGQGIQGINVPKLTEYFQGNNPGQTQSQVNGAISRINGLYNAYASGGRVLGASTGGGSAAAPAGNPEDAAYFQDILNQLQGQLGQVRTARDQGLTSLADSFNLSNTRLNQQRSNTLRDFGIKQGQLDTNRRGTLNEINSGAAKSSKGLLNLLASRGAGVSSAAQYAVPGAISSYYGGQRGKALGNYGQQQQGLDIAKTDAEQQYGNALTDLANQRREKERQLREGSLNTENDILGRLTDAATKLTQARGGTYTGGAGARQPFLNQLAANNAAISNLFNQFRSPTYNVTPVNVKVPDVNSYSIDPLAIDLAGRGTPVDTSSTYLPFFNQKKEEKNPYGVPAAVPA